ncbi:MAG: hypothetical protein KC443_06050 [Anaerolineales bacterium]|nr:hypothetical protein [Anaerolineales bacterium]
MVHNTAIAQPEMLIQETDMRQTLKPKRIENLHISPFNSDGWNPRYVVKDPTGEFYISTGKGGITLLEMLDGQHTLDELQQKLLTEHRMNFTLPKIESFVDMCNRSNLLEVGSWVEVTAEERKKAKKKRMGGRLGFYKQLIGGERLLNWLMTHQGWWYNRVTAVFALIFIFIGLGFAIFPPEQGGFAAPINQIGMNPADLYLTLLPLIFLVEISFHELAHSLACRVFGAQAGGFGFGLVWGVVPVFYTKTTDAYTIDNKYKRMMVSAAGPLVDLAFLGMFGLITLLTPADTLAHRLALGYTAFPLSVILINLNPFLIRMDGYWILSDYLELPNLRRSAIRYLSTTLRHWLGLADKADSLAEPLTDSRRHRLIYSLYGLVSVIWTVTFVSIFVYSIGQSVAGLLMQLTGAG